MWCDAEELTRVARLVREEGGASAGGGASEGGGVSAVPGGATLLPVTRGDNRKERLT